MADVLLTTEDLTVLGGPSSLNLEIDFGPKGDRGSQIFVNLGKPTSVFAPGAQLFDLYINILSSDDEYQYMYQLQNVLGTNTWVKLFKLVSNIYSKNYSTTSFVDGVWSKNIPVSEIIPAEFVGTASASNFNVQYSVLNQNPLASSISIGEIASVNGTLSLPVTINATEFDGTTWANLDTIKTVHLFITVV
jgi:hypothetical protein